MNALISVYHKEGIETAALALHQAAWTIYSTGGTFQFLKSRGIPAVEISSLTGFPEILGGRVKTLHPKVFAPILAKHEPEHLAQLKSIDSHPFSLVIVNFYPFESALISEHSKDQAYMTEQIDIGGPAMVRAAAKNHRYVGVITDPDDYSLIERFIRPGNPEEDFELRLRLAFKAFSYTSYYDHLVSSYFNTILGEQMPLYFSFSGRKQTELRYGENPQQAASLYQSSPASPLRQLTVLWGKPLSFNNMLDLSTVYEITNAFHDQEPFAVIVKHQNPCGAAQAASQVSAFINALAADPVSAFGGIVGFNQELCLDTAIEINKTFFEVIVAPEFSPEALQLLKKKKNLRLIKWPVSPPSKQEFRQVPGGFLLQDCDTISDLPDNWKYPSGTSLDEEQMKTALFGLKMIKFIKSNAILLTHDRSITGVGAGQMSRIDSVRMAIEKAGERCRQSMLISDAFFPFADSIELAHQAGIETVIEPGGSIRDDEVIKKAQELQIRLIITGIRHFRH